MRWRDTFTAPNVAAALLLLGSDAVVPASRLPAGLGVIGAVLPLRHAVDAARLAVAGGGVGTGQLLAELGVGLAWVAADWLALRQMVARSRGAGAFDLL